MGLASEVSMSASRKSAQETAKMGTSERRSVLTNSSRARCGAAGHVNNNSCSCSTKTSQVAVDYIHGCNNTPTHYRHSKHHRTMARTLTGAISPPTSPTYSIHGCMAAHCSAPTTH